MTRIDSEAALREGLEQLARLDPDLGAAYRDFGAPPLRNEAPGYRALLRIIVGQQVSVASASAIWNRLLAACGGPRGEIQPEGFLALDEDALKAVGFSRQKTAYGRAIADDLVSGRVDLEALTGLNDEAAIAELCKLKGIGRWSAEVYLLFSLGRPDVFPADDLGLMIGVQKLKQLAERPDAKTLRDLVAPWQPWRAVAARLIWHVRGNLGLPEDAR